MSTVFIKVNREYEVTIQKPQYGYNVYVMYYPKGKDWYTMECRKGARTVTQAKLIAKDFCERYNTDVLEITTQCQK